MNRSQIPPLPDVKWLEGPVLVFDPAPLSGEQRTGNACVVCSKRYPRPRVAVGKVPDGRQVRACEDCAELVPTPAESRNAEAARRAIDEAFDEAAAFAAPVEQPLMLAVIADVLRDAKVWLPHVAPDPLAAIALVLGKHTVPETTCTECQMIRECASALASHLRRTEILLGQDQLPAPIRDPYDARLWLVAWAAECPPAAIIAEVFDAVIDDLARGVQAQ